MKVHPVERANIARAYFAGTAPSQLSRDHRISPTLVIQIAKKWEQKRLERRRTMRRTLPPPTVMYAWKAKHLSRVQVDRGEVETRDDGGLDVTLPYVSILGRQ